MKILCLYNNACAIELFDWLNLEGHEIVKKSDKLDVDWCIAEEFDLTVSYTYRYILSQQHLHALKDNVVNIHNSVLPWNRGSDPNIWSYLEDTPRGVTLHYMDASLDKGFIIAQKLIHDGIDQTLKSSYDNLDKAAKEMFKEAFQYYPYWRSMKKKALGNGSYHTVKDGLLFKQCIDSFDMSIISLKEKYYEVLKKQNIPGGGYTEINWFLFLKANKLESAI